MKRFLLNAFVMSIGFSALAAGCDSGDSGAIVADHVASGGATTGGEPGTGGEGVEPPLGGGGLGGSGNTEHLPLPVGEQFEAECAHGPNNGSCFGEVVGSQVGTQLENQGNRVGNLGATDYLAYENLDFAGVNLLRLRYASAYGGDIDFRLDSPTGTLLASWQPPPTGSVTSYAVGTVQLTPADGVHALYVIGVTNANIAGFDWFVLESCIPDCDGKDCGDNGCGVPCGECTGTDSCGAEGKCEPCIPNCDGKECGDDGCEGSCGSPCADGEVCTAERTCVPYEDLGGPPRVRAEGNDFVGPDSAPVVLRGVSLIDVAAQHVWRDGIPAMIDTLTGDGWGTKILRFPVYIEEQPQPFSVTDRVLREEYMAEILRPAVDYATSRGLYVIIDLHRISNVTVDEDAKAQAFWGYMAPQFADYQNVIYELYNEPIDSQGACVSGGTDSCWPPFKAKAEGWIEIIRETAPDTLILVGGPSWSQVIGPAADDPVSDPNTGYVAHIYPMHMGNNDYVEQQIRRCAAARPVILTEWGFGFAGEDDKEPYATTLKAMTDELGLSWTAWVADFEWGPPMFTPTGGVTEFGAFAKAWLAE
ncbi:MAG: cellulase family glycosylhydrolase [Polyangiaceae bacterium]|nr:cellulase family glycosylhydrolase [Polyangiaceae bacterium]